MRADRYRDEEDIHALNRSPFRNLPSDCRYCGYRNLPSSSIGGGCECCSMHYNSKKNR